MAKLKNVLHKWAVGKIEGGDWLAVSCNPPYFCFRGTSQKEVDAKANRALDYYFGIAGQIDTFPLPRRRQSTFSTFSRRKVVERDQAE